MGNWLRCVAIVSLTIVVCVLFFKSAMWPGSLMTIPRKGLRWQEMVAVKRYQERSDEALDDYSTHEQTRSELDLDNGYHRRAGDQAQVAEPAKQNGESRMSFTTRKLVPEFHSKRQIPGGPDGQHHGSNGR